MSAPHGNVPDIETIKSQAYRPKRAVITAGMPYANGPLHVGSSGWRLMFPQTSTRGG